MCTDYIDLNKTYPKDAYSLLSIDSTSGWSCWSQSVKLSQRIFWVQSNTHDSDRPGEYNFPDRKGQLLL